ncbi:hypothetical protein PV327_000061 [Microctonus hyperodae]|uniref:Hexosyltransferase n=1 Tax=Microctonus hyperodae TaxID=165561 RepID=A0AA39G6E0_MICHY|nr:hypothetical protein PV327_000061 [Microctonus hyperodae]
MYLKEKCTRERDPITVSSFLEANQREEETRLEVERLTAEIRTLKLHILQLTGGPPGHSETFAGINSTEIGDCLIARRQVDFAEISQGLPLNNEYELIAFSHFTFSRLYPVDLGLGKRVVEKPIGFKRKDLLEALAKAVDILNKNISSTGGRYTQEDFLEGLYRVDPTTGTQYEMYFRTKTLNKSSQVSSNVGYTKIVMMRPYAPIHFVSLHKQHSKEKELIHIILPLSGRTGTFQSFMDKFVKIALKNDRRVHLTVVYFGTEGLSEARAIMSRVLMTRGSGGTNQNLRLLALNETFSRGKGLRVGAERVWSGDTDVLLFMCDVDVVFSARFLDRCRWNTAPGRKVYYPIVFSLYNPHVVYTLQGREVPPERDQLVLPWLTRIKEADLRTLTSGKIYHAHSKIITGTEKIHLMVVEYQVGKHLILQSEDQFIRQRIEMRTKRYHNQTILTIKVYSKRTSALFHHTVGRAVQYFINKQLETSLIHAAEIYIAILNELKIP